MPTPQGTIEVYSAVEDCPEILEACRVLRVNGICDACGSKVDRLHAPSVCHGWYCSDHCLVCTGTVSISDVEREAMATNRVQITNQDWRFARIEATKRAQEQRRLAVLRAQGIRGRAFVTFQDNHRITRHFTHRTFRGRYGDVWELIESGMTVADLLVNSKDCGIRGETVRDILRKMTHKYRVLTISE